MGVLENYLPDNAPKGVNAAEGGKSPKRKTLEEKLKDLKAQGSRLVPYEELEQQYYSLYGNRKDLHGPL
jgi:hypothetical protein